LVTGVGGTPKCFFHSTCTEWKPLYLQSTWEDTETTHYLSVIVLLPGGVSEQDLLDYKVEDEGRTLVVVVAWPSLMMDMERVQAYW